MPKVSIIVPIYNMENYLNRCLDSIINQTYKDIEIILVNDGSKDNSLKICKEYAKNDKRIILIDQKNGGVSSARNNGLDKATGEYLAFVDPDDWIDKDGIEKMVDFALKQKCDIAFFDYKINDEIQKSEKVNLEYTKETKDEFIKLLISGEVPGYLWRLLIKKDIIKKSKFKLDLPMAEDLVFILEILNNVNKINKLEDAFYNYFLTENSITRGSLKYKKNLHNTFLLNKYINKLYKEHEKIANSKHISEIGLYLLKMHRDGYDEKMIKEEFDFLVNDKKYKEMKQNYDQDKLSKIDKNIMKFIEKNNYNQMIKYFEKLIKKSVLEYKINRIKNRIRGVKNEF